MKRLTKPTVEFFGAVPTDYESSIKFIKKAGCTCYKSEDKIPDTSAEKFVQKLIKAEHLAMVEHSNLVIRRDGYERFQGCEKCPSKNLGRYLTIIYKNSFTYIGGNLTAWAKLEAPLFFKSGVLYRFKEVYGHLFDLKNTSMDFTDWEICPQEEIPKELHRYSARFICDRGVSHELVRHRPCSFAQESTRYVNYAKKDAEFIEPAGFDGWEEEAKEFFIMSCDAAYSDYIILLSKGLTPQQARAVLPHALKTEIVVTADLKEWEHIFKLRCHKSAHPDMVRVMTMLKDKFLKRGIING